MRVRGWCFGPAGLSGRDRIKAPRMPWMTFAEPSASEQTAARYAMFDDSLLRVIGTAGEKAAVLTQKGTDAELVASQ